MKYIQYFLFVFLSLTTFFGFAQSEVEFKAEVSRKTLGQNERLRVEFSMNKDGDNFSPPNFDGFQVIMGPSQSVSNSWINGKRSFSKSYIYILQPQRKGKLTIGVASVEIEGKQHYTKSISVEVGDPVKNPQNQSANTNPRSSGFPFGFDPFFEEDTSTDQIPEVTKDQIFVSAEISKTNPYWNEPISIVYKIYLSDNLGISGFEEVSSPKYLNFVKEDIPIKRPEIENCTYNGKNYRCIVVKRVVLYPQKSGQLALEPLSLSVGLQVPTNRVDIFGRRQLVSMTKNLSAGNQIINVKELPEEGKPANFSGAVGSFTMEANLSKKELKADETLGAKIIISGKGNFKLFEMPKLNFPSALEVYDPEHKEEVTTSLSGLQGKVTDIYTIVPQYKGKYPIPSVSFNFFNPETGKYVTQESGELLIDVIEGATSNQVAQKQDVTPVEAFRFLKLKPDLLPMEQKAFFGSVAFYLYWLLPLLLIPLGIFYWNWREVRQNDAQGNRIRRANRLAKKYLSSAKKNLGQKDAFYESLERGLHNYLKAKLHIETSELSKERIRELLSEKTIHTEPIEDFLRLLANCEMARYSPYTQTDMQNDYQKATQVISIL
ncbi:BatD family protein [Capnocytophaga catalasegens]|uniref:Protein BatD n=1 Tax=Capnocytophaga catalasegens TaxID=1004260 RepID=A0AAV5AU56_9FLAO|nr:BatD family protein [Capnocytophaga catalasegens]GIZ14614.1 hypothetical protein RCZ03_06150 [Capnocytophaga catalasegens]GJM50816.1 hypothetical protein RCZ15_17890 [Capnocytophaga catalasegens]GJM51969.1 hypothetical protein RCZ16_02870 [Capnocytophaga catalasegens]